MKKKFYIPLFFWVVFAPGFTQVKPPVKKVHGYKQATIPGILPVFTEENDILPVSGSKPNQNHNYWFYIELPKTETITVTGLWIRGIPHAIKNEIVLQLPVRKIVYNGTDKNDTTIMVPFTKNKVQFIYPSGERKEKMTRSAHIRGLAEKNELVIAYVWKKKTYYTTIKKLKEIAPDVRS